MKYQDKNKKIKTIGVFAPSSGIGDRIEKSNIVTRELEKIGYKIKFTESVINDNIVSNTPEIRIKELNSLLTDDEVDVIFCASGGDFAIEIAPYIDYELLNKYPKYIIGFSDGTIITYLTTTGADVATITSYNYINIARILNDSSLINLLAIINGKDIIQKDYEKYEEVKETDVMMLTKENKYLSNKNNINVTGRIIGGTIDCISDIIGMPYDKTNNFINKYSSDGIIWYFDIFAMDSNNFYRTLLRMKHLNYFTNVKAVLVGKKTSYCKELDISYDLALEKIFKDIPVIKEVDIGHIYPHISIINGSVANISYNNGDFNISFELK